MKSLKFLAIAFITALSVYGSEANAKPVAAPVSLHQRIIVRTTQRYPVQRRVVHRRVVRRYHGRPAYHGRAVVYRRPVASRYHQRRVYSHRTRVYRNY